ncbi:hypothetical protein CEQ28_016445 [Hafnia alvei]|nr:hypothetical protein CEQ28_016445 [Hafnia alvei]
MQRQAMGVALHIVLLPNFLNYCIAHLIRNMPTFSRHFFLPSQTNRFPLLPCIFRFPTKHYLYKPLT